VQRSILKDMETLQELYKKVIVPEMVKKMGYKNVMAVPKIKKVVVNVGFGKLVAAKSKTERDKIAQEFADDLSLIIGQKPVFTTAKTSISSFKTRAGMVIGAKTTLRGKKMYDFVSRLINIALPRTSDFKGIDKKTIDKSGNLTIGIKEHIVFPEVSPESVKRMFPFEVTIVSSAKNQEEAIELFKLYGFPIK
jgi:large subunit ribosomal protein L5